MSAPRWKRDARTLPPSRRSSAVARFAGRSPRCWAALGHEPTALGVARLYADLVSTFVLDPADAELAPAIESLGLRAVVVPTVMVDPLKREEIGRGVVEALT